MNKAPKNKLRKGETPGTGIILLVRCKKTGMLKSHAGTVPFEHESIMAAAKERTRLLGKHEDIEVEIYSRIEKRS